MKKVLDCLLLHFGNKLNVCGNIKITYKNNRFNVVLNFGGNKEFHRSFHESLDIDYEIYSLREEYDRYYSY